MVTINFGLIKHNEKGETKSVTALPKLLIGDLMLRVSCWEGLQ